MDILHLRRSLWPLRGFRNEDGDGGAGGSMGASGQSSGPGGTSGSGGYGGGSGGYDGGYSADSYGGALGLSGYGGYYGGVQGPYNARQGFGEGLTADGLGPGTNISDVANALGMTEDAVRQAFNQESTFSQIASMVPGVLGIGLRAAAKAVGPSNIFGRDGTVSSQAATASASAGGFNPSGNGSNSGNGGAKNSGQAQNTSGAAGSGAATPNASQTLNDLISSHFGTTTTSGTDAYTAPNYNADPTGMVAGGQQFMANYQQDYAPYAAKMRSEVDRIGTPEYLQQQRGLAMANQQQQYDNTMQQNQRGMARMGVNPSSGRMMAMQNQGAIQNAAAKVGAAAQAEGMVHSNYMAGLGAVNTMGMDTAKMGQGWATQGLGAAKDQNTWNLANSELGLRNKTQNQTNAYQWGSLANQKYGIDNGLVVANANNTARANQSTNDNLWTLGTAVAGKALGSDAVSNWWSGL